MKNLKMPLMQMSGIFSFIKILKHKFLLYF